MEFIVKDRRLAETIGEDAGDLGDEVAFLPGEGKRHAKAFAAG